MGIGTQFRNAAMVTAFSIVAGAARADHLLTGERIAVEACSACHQVTARQVLPPPVPDPDEATSVPAPSFFDLATMDAETLRARIKMPPHPMREQDWNDGDLNDVVTYIRSLHRETPKPAPSP
jgi:mono/diheme cytochrome c family protein